MFAKRNLGVSYALSAYFLWGLAPIYFKSVQGVPAAEIIIHRIIWSILFLSIFLLIRDGRDKLAHNLKEAPVKLLTLSGLLIAFNWFIFVYAVNTGRILETSLGYFINPIISVGLGMLFLRERLNVWQWIALALSAAGTFYFALGMGQFPWLSLALAFSFGFYGLIRKRTEVASTPGLLIEVLILGPFAITYGTYLFLNGHLEFTQTDWGTRGLLVLAGLVSTVPLVLFANGARRLPLTTMGFFQYLAPSISFLLGVFVYHESFTPTHLVTFLSIWIALTLLGVDAIIRYKMKSPQA